MYLRDDLATLFSPAPSIDHRSAYHRVYANVYRKSTLDQNNAFSQGSRGNMDA